MTKDQLREAAIAELEAVDAGQSALFLSGERTWDEEWCGDVSFETSNGWKFTVFNDCGEWDYLTRCESPSGAVLDGEEWPDFEPKNVGIWRHAARKARL